MWIIFELQLAKVEQRARADHVTDKPSDVFQNVFWFLRHNTMVSNNLLGRQASCRKVPFFAIRASTIRSQFEHCSPVWRPNSATMMDKFENFQKKCIKWILGESNLSYSNEVYLRKCKQLNILPLSYRFETNDMILFYKIIHSLIPVNMPNYLTLFNGNSRLRSSHLDELSFVCNLATPMTGNGTLNKSFFFRSHLLWNTLPFDIRNSPCLSEFKNKLHNYFRNLAVPEQTDSEEEWSFLSSDENRITWRYCK